VLSPNLCEGGLLWVSEPTNNLSSGLLLNAALDIKYLLDAAFGY
jgi:hypothetical protein